MTRIRFLPLFLPLLLLAFSFWKAGLHTLYVEAQAVERRAVAAQSRLDTLQALSVASRIDSQKYENLVLEFSELTGLPLDSEYAVSKGEVSAQVARFVDAVVEGLHDEEFAGLVDERAYLLFQSVTPGQRQVVEPFLLVDFELNLKGRFFAVPRFLSLLSRIAADQRCAISIGVLEVARVSELANTGELVVTLPLRAYFLER